MIKINEIVKVIKILNEEKRKEEANLKQNLYLDLQKQELNFPIIQDLINSAQHGVVIELKFPNGTTAVLRREDDYDRIKKTRVEDLY